MEKRKPRRRSSLTLGEKLIFIAGILLCLVLITTAMMGGLFARYVTTGTGSDWARVAKFGDLTLTETGDFDGTAVKQGMIIPGVNLQKKAVVEFKGSEMSTFVFVEVILSEQWTWSEDAAYAFTSGEHLSWNVDTKWTWLTQDVTAEGNRRVIYYRHLPPNEPLKADIIAEDGRITVSDEITKDQIGNLDETFIHLRAGVIQSGEFETVEAAWAAMDAK